ncbi:secretory lipase [Corynebacterium efficiens YS-314]|nr:lipase family protein [Corynebacterium efficiens]EEW49721.1 secretory lipase [Corynebacterium efficiens YS-314]
MAAPAAYKDLTATRVIRAGNHAATRRVLLPLIDESARSLTRLLTGRQRRPDRAGSQIIPDPTAVPDFGTATSAPGMEPGTLVNVAPLRVLGTRGELNPASSYRFEYITEDPTGRAITATGGVCLSKTPHLRDTPRPVVAFAPSTQGVAAHCDPSHTCAIGLSVFPDRPVDAIAAYELPVLTWFLAQGVDVIFIDYPRDPVAGIQYYCDSITAAGALVDAIRAARHLGITPDQPLGLWGFSQGGGAVGWAAQLSRTTPDINPIAAVVGAPPSDLPGVLRAVDGGMLTGVIAYAVAGLAATRPELHDEILPVLTSHGLTEILRNIATCAGGTVITSAYENTTSWTTTGQSLGDILDDLPGVLREFERQQLGRITPGIPVLLWGSTHDDVIPVHQVRDVRDRWVARGADVTWHESGLPRVPGRTGLNHFGPYFRHLTDHSGWLLDRLHGA